MRHHPDLPHHPLPLTRDRFTNHLSPFTAEGPMADPDRYFRPPYAGPKGWVGIRLDRRPRWTEVAEMVREAYELTRKRR
jgi:hypothetical protein